MTPEQAVTMLGQILAGMPEPNEDAIYNAMAQAGIPDDVADLAYKFTQIAWGRLFLSDMGIQFSPDYFCVDGEGNIVESGRLEDHLYYRTAVHLQESKGLYRLAM